MTGTFAGLIPVREVDGRVIGRAWGAPPAEDNAACRGPITARLQGLYVSMVERAAAGGRQRLEG